MSDALSMATEQQHIEITTNGRGGTVVVDGTDLSDHVVGYQIEHRGGQTPLVVLFAKAGSEVHFDGMATVAVADQTPPGEAVAEFLTAVDPAALDRAAINRDLDGSSNELTKAMLAQLIDWALGKAG